MADHNAETPIPAIVAAAGMSRRMGEPKQLLPWGEGTVIEAVVNTLAAAAAEPVVCIIGHQALQMRAALRKSSAQIVYNSAYAQGEMLSSYQAGIQWLIEQGNRASGLLLALSDQPHLPMEVVRDVCTVARTQPDAIVIPSHQMRRGHPIYLPRRFWSQALKLPKDATLRTLIQQHDDAVFYVNLNQPAILADLDTPEDYRRLQPKQ